MKYTIFIFYYFILTTTVLKAQIKVEGNVFDKESKSPLEGVTIVFKNQEQEIAVFSDDNGYFKTELSNHQKFSVNASSVFTENLQFDFLSTKDTSLMITLSTINTVLDEVVIQKKKKVIESKIDRLVYNINNDPLAKTLSTEDLIKRIPLLRLRDNNLSIVGKGAVNVTVNGKLQQVSSSELVSFLSNFDPSMLKSIEVITTPPANFSAQGNAGIINIVTSQKNGKEENWNASLRTTYIQRSLPGSDNGLTFNYNKNKFSASTSLNYTLTQLKVDLENNGNGIKEITDRRDKGNRFGGYLNLNYQPAEKHDIAVSFNVFDAINENNYTNQRNNISTYLTDGNRRNEQTRYSGDINYTFKIDTLGKTITAFASYNANLPTERFKTFTVEQGTSTTEALNNLGKQSYKALSAQLDFHFPYGIGKLDYGVQYYSLTNDATIQYNFDNSLNAESFLYDENNYALYAGFTTKELGPFTFKGGLRYEYNDVYLENKGTNTVLPSRKKGNLFPSFYALYSMDNGDKLSVNYSKRINRPGFSVVTPFRWYNNPYSYEIGNPFILPYLSNNIQVNYTKGDFMISAYGQFIKNGYGDVDLFENNEWIYTYENYLDQTRYGITTSYTLNKMKWWESDLYATFYQNNLKSKVDYIEDKTGYGFSYQINNNILLDRDKKYMISLNYWQDLPFWNNNIYNHSFGSLDLGANVSLLDKKLNLSLLFTDIANQSITKTRAEFTNYIVYRREYFDARSFRVSLRYNFGSSSIKSVKKMDKFNERNRMN
ncbi:outer membrane beta-barrel family protein [Sphingobacterium faecium]|uniref:outer membrane beta-barrel family protein n=1 Tax=Sphingobacterium faecium TaxID=34087 RepID=UPI00320ABAE0